MSPSQEPLGDAGESFWSGPMIAFWLVALLAALWLRGPRLAERFTPPEDRYTDFFQEWASARNLAEGLPVYTDQAEAVRRYLGWELADPDGPGIKYNAHPPTSVLLAVPLAAADYHDAQFVWNLAMFALFLTGLALTIRGIGIRFSAWSVLPTATLILLATPVDLQVAQGQLNPLLLVLIVGAWLCDRSCREWPAGALLGAATAVKLFPGFLFLYFVFRGRWRSVASGAGTFLALTGLTAAAMGTEPFHDYVGTVVPAVGEQFRDSWYNASLTGFWSRLFGPMSLNQAWTWAAVGLSALAVTVLVARVTLRADTQDAGDRAFVAALVGMLLVSPITWVHYFLLLILPLAWLWQRSPFDGARRWAPRVILPVFWVHPSVFIALSVGVGEARRVAANWADPPAASPWETLTGVSVPFYALLGLFWLLISAKPERRCGHKVVDRSAVTSSVATDPPP